jgi:hypothetical protein
LTVPLTGVPLIVIAAAATASVCAVTVLLWSRFGRWRLLSRSLGVLLSEALLVLAVGLIVNRVGGFYPTWQALHGDTGASAVTTHRTAGHLDAALRPDRVTGGFRLAIPDGQAQPWRMAAPPTLVVPADYIHRPTATFPVLVTLTDDPRAAAVTTVDAVTVVVAPSTNTTAAALSSLPAAVTDDVRATSHGWAVVADLRDAALAADLIRATPTTYDTVVLVAGSASTGVPPAVLALPDVTTAVVRPPPAGGAHSAPVPQSVAAVTSPPSDAWQTASVWAVAHTSQPLGPPLVLPTQIPAKSPNAEHR